MGTNANGNEVEMHISENQIVTVERQNVAPLFNQNKRLLNDGGGRAKGMWHIGSVDSVTYHNWRKEWRANHSDKWEWKTWVTMKLRDRDFSKYRTTDFRI